MLHQFREGLLQGLARKMWCLWYKGMRFDTTLGLFCPWTLQICVGQKKDLFFLAKIRAWNLVQMVNPTLWIRETGSCSAPSQAPAILVTSSAQNGKFVLYSTCWLDRPFVAVYHFRSLSLLWDSVVKHLSCPSTHSIALKTQTQITLLERWRSAEWLCRNDPSTLWKQTASIWVTFALLEEKNRGGFHYFYRRFPCRISSALGEHSSLLCLVNQQNYKLSSKWGLSIYPDWLCAYALNYSCAILLQERGCGSVQHGLGNLFMADDDDRAKKKMIWSPQVSSWAFSLGRGVWGLIFNMWIEQICCWHWESGGGAPQRSFGNTAFKNSNNVRQLWIFLWWITFVW